MSKSDIEALKAKMDVMSQNMKYLYGVMDGIQTSLFDGEYVTEFDIKKIEKETEKRFDTVNSNFECLEETLNALWKKVKDHEDRLDSQIATFHMLNSRIYELEKKLV